MATKVNPTTTPIYALMLRCHAGSKAKGFWDETPDKGQQAMLACGELAEAQEAHRNGKKVSPTIVWDVFERNRENPDTFAIIYKAHIKGSIEEEMADAYIRLGDFAVGYGVAKSVAEFYNAGEFSYKLAENFGAALYQINAVMAGILTVHTGYISADSIAEALRGIEALCAREGYDLQRHIGLKLIYNATRPVKHGKGY